MNRNGLRCGTAVVCLVVFLAGCPQTVYIPDRALESAMRAEVGKFFGPLTSDDLLDIRALDARDLGIRDLTGIEYCRNLAWLDLDTNSISDLTPLEQLGRPESPFDSPLEYLNLDDNQISDIAPLAGLLNLRGLSLFNNQISDIQALIVNAGNGGLGNGDYVILDSATLNEQSTTVDVPLLIAFGVNVTLAAPAGSS